MRRFPWLLLTALLAVGIAVPASAQSADEVSERAAESGYYVDSGLDVDQDALADAVRRASNAGVRLLVVLLDDDPAAGASTFADAVLDGAAVAREVCRPTWPPRSMNSTHATAASAVCPRRRLSERSDSAHQTRT